MMRSVVVPEPIETPHSEGTIVVAITSSDTTTVDHDAQAIVIMHSGGHRTDLFAGSRFALVTSQRLVANCVRCIARLAASLQEMAASLE